MKEPEKAQKTLIKELEESRKQIAKPQMLENKYERAVKTLRRSKEAAKRLIQQNAVMAEIGRIISSSLRIEEVYERFAEEAQKLIPFDRLSIGIINDIERTIKVAYVAGTGMTHYSEGSAIPFEKSLYGNIVPSRSSLLVQTEDESEVLRLYPALQRAFRAGFRSMMAVPLVSKNRVIAFLHFRSKKPGVYTDADLKLAERVGVQIAGAIASSQLFIERQRVEEALRKSEERFEQVAENAGEWIWEVDAQGRYIYASPVVEKILGYTPEEVVGKKHFYDFFSPDVREGIKKKAYEIFAGKEAFRHFVSSYVHKNGNLVYLETNGVPILDSEGNLLGYRGADTDITDRKRAEEAFHKSEEEAKRLAQENATIAEIGRIISSTSIVEEAYDRFSEEVRKLIPFDRVVITTHNTEENTITFAYMGGTEVPGRRVGETISLGATANEALLSSRSGLLIQTEDATFLKNRFPSLLVPFRAGFRSMMVVPLVSGNQVIGVLSLLSLKSNAYTETDLRLAEKVGTQVAGAIANAQLFAEYRRAEKAVRESEERFRDLYDNAPLGYHEYDAEGRIISVNRTDLDMLGYTRDEMVGQFMWKFYAEEETARQEILAKVEGALPYGRSIERTYRRKDGTTIPVLIGERVILDERGQIKSLRCTIQDITDRKESEEALEKSWSRYRTLFNSSGDAILIHDLEGRVLEVNQVACDRLGYSQDEFAQMTLGQIVSSEHAASVPRLIEEELNRGHALFETVHVSKDGRAIPTEVSSVVFEYNGHPAVLSVVRDITERKRTEETLIRLGTAVSQSIDGIVVTNVDGHVQFVNESWSRMHGHIGSELVGQHLNIFHTKEQMVDVIALIGAAMNMGFDEAEIGHVRADGIAFPTWMSCTVLKDPNGTFMGFVSIARDITEKKKTEVALLEAKEKAEMANRELEIAIGRANELAIEAERANQAKSEFLANMSHEIRTPMNGIMGMTSLLLDTTLTAEQKDYAETIKDSTDSLLGIINDILDFSKMEAGKLDLEILAFDLRTTLEDLTGCLALNAHAKGLELLCLIEPDVPALVQGAPGRLRQILTNLIGNAIKFTHKGEVSLHVSVNLEDEIKSWIRFSVKDTGIGIPQDKIGRLFHPFTQADASITRRYGGTGLGLSISRQLCEMMEGEIGAESKEGRGSTFWITLPLTKQTTVVEKEPEVHPDIAGTRILVVDDNATNRMVLAGMLETWNCYHDEAFDASSAMEKLHAAAAKGVPFRIALLDMFMPGMDGEALGRRIKDDPVLRNTLLVMISSVGKRGDALRLERAGFTAYLTKPVKQSLLYDCLITVLNRKRDDKSSYNRITARHTVAETRKKKVRILLAEDNTVNQKVTLKILEKMGYHGDAVANGIEALKALETIPYTLVLMDVQMPEMDGIEATWQIRNGRWSIRNPDIPIIALTANAMKKDREKCIEAGMNDYLAKPIQPEELAKVISRWIPGNDGTPKVQTAAKIVKQGLGFDGAALLERLEGDEKSYDEVIALFLQDVPRQIRSLQEAVSRGDITMAERQAHTLKGASGSVGAVGLQKVTLEIEKACKEGHLKEVIEMLDMIKAEFEELQQTLGSQKEGSL